jgi:predicted SAM-dependent methyltransferase
MQFSLNRKITSYAKVRNMIAQSIRGSKLFIKHKRITGKVLLNVGCGPNPKEEFINLDYIWSPNIDICWDITKKNYPLADHSLEGIYTEHCLEHIPLEDCEKNLAEFHRLLKPGATLRVVVPDGEIYLDIYQRRKNGENIKMPHEEGYISPMARINGIFRNHGHLFIYDFETMKLLLTKVGFKDIKKESFRKGRDPRLLIDLEWRENESLYVEATA